MNEWVNIHILRIIICTVKNSNKMVKNTGKMYKQTIYLLLKTRAQIRIRPITWHVTYVANLTKKK